MLADTLEEIRPRPRDENDDRYREEPWTKNDARAFRIMELKGEIADLKAEIIALRNLVNDLDYCRFHSCDLECTYFNPGDKSYCGLDLDERLGNAGR